MSAELLWLAVTLGAYVLARGLERGRTKGWALPVAAVGLWLLVRANGVPPASYETATRPLTFLLGPATVALAVPLVRHWPLVARRWRRVMLGVTLGAGVSSATAGLLTAWWGPPGFWRTLLPHSATTPIALPLVTSLGGSPQLAAVATVLTGLLGSVLGPGGLVRFGIRDPLAPGIALGTASSGIGTARALQQGSMMGAVAGLAMALSGVVITLLCLPYLIGRG